MAAFLIGCIILVIVSFSLLVRRDSKRMSKVDALDCVRDIDSIVENQKVCFVSKKYGWQNGYKLGPDNSGRIIIGLIARDGHLYTVRRQPNMVHRGWRFKAIRDPMSTKEFSVLKRRIELASGYGAVGLPETFEEFNIAPLSSN